MPLPSIPPIPSAASLVDLTPVSAATTLAAFMFGTQASLYIGPYVIIFLGASLGAAVALLNKEGLGRFRAILYWFGMMLISVLITVPISIWLASFSETLKENWLFFPVAMGMGYAGDKWATIYNFIGGLIGKAADMYVTARSNK